MRVSFWIDTQQHQINVHSDADTSAKRMIYTHANNGRVLRDDEKKHTHNVFFLSNTYEARENFMLTSFKLRICAQHVLQSTFSTSVHTLVLVFSILSFVRIVVVTFSNVSTETRKKAELKMKSEQSKRKKPLTIGTNIFFGQGEKMSER